MKIKESETMEKLLDLGRELKENLWNMILTVIPIVVGAIGTVSKGLEKELKELKISERIMTVHSVLL